MFCVTLPCFTYTFDHIWTNLLTQCTQLPVAVFCCFCISGFPAIKSAPKIPEKSDKNQRLGSFSNNQEREGGPPLGAQEGPWRGPTLGRARRPPGCLVGPPGAPLRQYLALGVETPNINPFSAISPLSRRRRRFKIGAAWRSCSGTLPEGGTPSGRPSIAMDASRMCREKHPLDHGSVTSSYVMYLSPLCASTFESS